MKKHDILVMMYGLLLMVLLTACQKDMAASGYAYEKSWIKAVSNEGISAYVSAHMDEFDMNELENTAGNDSLSLKQQFQATVLLCEIEYQKYLSDNGGAIDIFAADYIVSADYASRFLAKAETSGAEFWEAIEDVSYPDSYFKNLLAAADSIAGQTLVKLITDCPTDNPDIKKGLVASIDMWMKEDPKRLIETGEQLAHTDYFKDKRYYDAAEVIFGPSHKPMSLDDVNQGLEYLQIVKTTMIPLLENHFSNPKQAWMKESELLEEACYRTGLIITTTDEVILNEEELL